MSPLEAMCSLHGRVVLVTGGAGHLGVALVRTLAAAGARVAIADRVLPDDERIRQSLGDLADQCEAFQVELADEAAVRALPDAVVARFGALDILVNCAAFVGTSSLEGWAVPFEQQATAAWRQALEVNLTSVFSLVQAATPALRRSGRGSIVNIGSIYGVVGPDLRLYDGTSLGNPAAYAASKGGLDQMTRWWSTVLAPEIRVNAVNPGGIARGQPEAFVERYVARTPLRRMATEDDMAGAVLYFASDMSRYVTGESFHVDGGLHLPGYNSRPANVPVRET